jgi:signal transduction histidine kinase
MRRLHVRIFFSLLSAVLVAMLFTGLISHLLFGAPSHNLLESRLVNEARHVMASLPVTGDRVVSQQAMERLAHSLALDIAVEVDGTMLVADGADLPRRSQGSQRVHWLHDRTRGPALAVPGDDGKWAVVRPRRDQIPLMGLRFVAMLASFAAALLLVNWWVSRRITRRLARLQHAVVGLGGGDLSIRVAVEGQDEVATLARVFNASAAQLQGLVQSQQRILASASHELRSPITRLRMAHELLADNPSPARVPELLDGATRDLAELDGLVEDVLLASRLQSGMPRTVADRVDLAAVVHEEAGRGGALVAVLPVVVIGSERMVRRLVRNLVENARRYGGGSPVEVDLRSIDGRAVLTVADRGLGVPEGERERIFEPFYRSARHSEGEHGGVGLGLSLVRQVAAHHGGTASYRPREGGGSEFVVTLPAVS